MEQQLKMVRVSVEVGSSTSRFRVGVQARSIRDALRIVEGSYPQGEVRVLFPIEPERFFVGVPSAPTMVVGHERIYQDAA